jgi:hypothetical protein
VLSLPAIGAAAPKAESRRRRVLKWVLHHPPVAALTAIIALIAAGVSLGYDLWPDLKPDPQAQLAGALTVVAAEPHVGYGDYLVRTHQLQTFRSTTPAGRRIWGEVFYVQIETQGLKRRRSELRGYIYNAKTRERWSDARAALRVKQGTPSDRLITPMWVQLPTDKGRYFVRFELRARGVMLAIANTPTFPYCKVAGCGGGG